MATADIKALRIAIVGSGMGGLAAALALANKGFQDISVYEHASNLGFVGAGIQLAPNMARILDRFGVWDQIAASATICSDTSIRQGSTDEQLSYVNLDQVEKLYGYPHMVGHRADLAGGLYAGCKKHTSVKFHFGQTVQEVYSWGPKPSFEIIERDGGASKRIEADVLLAADGIKSRVREQMLKTLKIEAKIIDTRTAAYRILLTRDELKHDPELLALLDSDTVTRWIGPRRHIIAYPVANKTIYNLSTAQPDDKFATAPSATYTTKGDKSLMLSTFADFCPKVQRMLALVPDGEVVEWKLRVHEPLPVWTCANAALLGDACHPTLPHLAQGAAQAIEDGAVLAEVLARLPSCSAADVHKALRVYEAVRRDRAYALVDMAAASGRTLHLSSGEAQKERDERFRSAKGNPDKWADADVQAQIYGFDCMKVAAEEFEKLFAQMDESVVNGA
ncbi:hypothetical protein ANO11243_029000 [Dothideomycetidae sp. 11243]|nr:hypothetical protein ANO11243_029000 [fungal sp. No.11243]